MTAKANDTRNQQGWEAAAEVDAMVAAAAAAAPPLPEDVRRRLRELILSVQPASRRSSDVTLTPPEKEGDLMSDNPYPVAGSTWVRTATSTARHAAAPDEKPEEAAQRTDDDLDDSED